MTYKQKPCPLCGRDMTAIETHPGRGELYCGHCDLTIGGNDAKTPEELIALMDGSEHMRLQAENAKLRKLMSVMAYCNQFRRDCDGCSLNGAAGIITERAGCDELLARLREMGVEVDG